MRKTWQHSLVRITALDLFFRADGHGTACITGGLQTSNPGSSYYSIRIYPHAGGAAWLRGRGKACEEETTVWLVQPSVFFFEKQSHSPGMCAQPTMSSLAGKSRVSITDGNPSSYFPHPLGHCHTLILVYCLLSFSIFTAQVHN